MRKEPFLEASDDDHRKLESLGAVHRHHEDASVLRPRLLVYVRQQRQLVNEASKRRFGVASLVLPSRRDQLHQVFDATLGFFAALLSQILEVAALVEDLS